MENGCIGFFSQEHLQKLREGNKMSDKRLLILGSVEDFTGLTKYAVERGIYTVVADGLVAITYV